MFEAIVPVIVTFTMFVVGFVGGVYYAAGKTRAPRKILREFFLG